MKVFAVHAMKAYKGRRGIAPLILQGKNPGTLWIGGRVGPRAVLNILKNRKIS